MNLLQLISLCLAAVAAVTVPVAAQTVIAPLAATVSVGSGSERIVGSGRTVSQERAVESFGALRADGPVNIELKASQRDHVTVRFDDNLVSMIDVRVVPGAVPTLRIGLVEQAAFRSASTPTVVVEFRMLSEISMRGSGDLRGDMVRGPILAVSMAGSGDVKLDAVELDVLGVAIAGSGDFIAAGRAAEQGFSIAGSGDISASRLIGKSVKVRVAGSGDARVHAEEMLDVSIAGSGDVLYAGNPSIKRRIAGSGDLRRMK